ncbi:hypothetical protein Taro_020408 [Colocasia esculenta]|uniref:Uncharacterized protein n=1 Tax=Colocasia esculenta TaxID=4460 RepID=A0A843UWD2_COLES|nr:hypothetical protein [Colocasia esculenta]
MLPERQQTSTVNWAFVTAEKAFDGFGTAGDAFVTAAKSFRRLWTNRRPNTVVIAGWEQREGI